MNWSINTYINRRLRKAGCARSPPKNPGLDHGGIEGVTYPIVLAHGIARFDVLGDLLTRELQRLAGGGGIDRILGGLRGVGVPAQPDSLEYFKGIASCLSAHGFEVYTTHVSFAAGVEQRSRDLRDAINGIPSLGKAKFHIIAHSMGGLDARHMIVNLGLADRVSSLTTIGTPHLGTSFADVGLEEGGTQLIDGSKSALKFNLDGFKDLTTEACRRFNSDPAVKAAEATNAVAYQTYASSEELAKVFGPLKPSWEIINEREGENDGLVPITSQAWEPQRDDGQGHVKQIRQARFPVSADHINEVGWWTVDRLRGELFSLGMLGEPGAYEQSIRDVYLGIAQGLSDLQQVDSPP
jgi:triacylglycerol lipase